MHHIIIFKSCNAIRVKCKSLQNKMVIIKQNKIQAYSNYISPKQEMFQMS
jgi:hypothetical protein